MCAIQPVCCAGKLDVFLLGLSSFLSFYLKMVLNKSTHPYLWLHTKYIFLFISLIENVLSKNAIENLP